MLLPDFLQFRMKKLRFLFIALLGLHWADGIAYTDKPVLVHLNIARQSDTMGFNLVYELQNKFYDLILTNKVKLWDSPRKSIVISPSSLQSIENSSGTKFNKTQNVFLHEFWTGSSKKTNFTIVGISFVNDNAKGKVSYGYVDLAECWAIAAAELIDCNVNGPASLTIAQALYSRNYNFNIVQFGGKDFRENPANSIKIRDKAFYSKRKVEGLYKIPKTKEVTYVVEIDANDKNEMGNTLHNNIQDYLNKNREVLFNIGGDRYFDYKNFKSEVAVTRIEVKEVWEKKSAFTDSRVSSIIIFVNNKALDPISIDLLLSWKIMYNFRSAEDVFREKKFKYVLLKMNNTFISNIDSEKYLKALEKYSWTQVSRYVKFY